MLPLDRQSLERRLIGLAVGLVIALLTFLAFLVGNLMDSLDPQEYVEIHGTVAEKREEHIPVHYRRRSTIGKLVGPDYRTVYHMTVSYRIDRTWVKESVTVTKDDYESCEVGHEVHRATDGTITCGWKVFR